MFSTNRTLKIVAALSTFIIGVTVASLVYQLSARRESTRVVTNIAALPVTMPPLNSAPQQAFVSPAIEIAARPDSEFPFDGMKFDGLSGEAIDVDLGLGNDIENQIIILHTDADDAREFKIEQQFETSMTVTAEGPHFDLTDWKHYVSAWREIKHLERNRFLIATISESEATKFPQVTNAQIQRAVRDKRWMNLARDCDTANTYPCAVSVSRISFKIKTKENGAWKTIRQLNFYLPMGC
jgi:hypothetical protein